MLPFRRLVVGTRNAGKLAEIRRLLADFPVEAASLDAWPDAPEVEEDGDTFEANACKKALETARAIGEWVAADDSGLEVDALGGAPGVRSARYAGDPKDDEANIAKLLQELRGTPPEERGARFRCVVALASPARVELVAEGACEGRIVEPPRGSNGFGYDPVFFYEPLGKTFAELSPEEKNAVSHRGRALVEFRRRLQERFGVG